MGTTLLKFVIPNSVTSIGIDAFEGTAWYNNQPDGLVYAGLVAYKYKGTLPSGSSITLRDGTLGIADYAFQYCRGLISIDIPNSVTAIGEHAFYYCSSLTSIDIPNFVITIGNYAFSGCSCMNSVTIGNSVTNIGDGAFMGCSRLAEIYSLALMPPTVYSYTFSGCYGATLFVPDIALDAYQSADSWKYFSNIVGVPYTFEVDGTRYHATTMNTANVMAHNDLATLYNGDVVIPDLVTYAGQTFAVTGIESNTFDGCFELTSVVIPNSVEIIGEHAFQGCTGLTSVTIGSGVTTIGAKAFNYCNALETVKCLGTVPPVMASTDCFTNATYNRATLFVPRNYEATYAAADYWYKFAHINGWGSAGRGDVNGDGMMNIADVTFLIDVLLTGDSEGLYFESADLNINGRLDIGDVTSLIDDLLNNY